MFKLITYYFLINATDWLMILSYYKLHDFQNK